MTKNRWSGATLNWRQRIRLIMEAKADLRPLTVFAGPSNTGKSCLAILM